MLSRDAGDDFLGFNSDWKEFHAIREMKYREYEDEQEHNEERLSFHTVRRRVHRSREPIS